MSEKALEAMSLAAEAIAVEVMPRLDEASDAELVEELLKRQYDFTKILVPRTDRQVAVYADGYGCADSREKTSIIAPKTAFRQRPVV